VRTPDAATATQIYDLVARHAHAFDNRSWPAMALAYEPDARIGGPTGDTGAVSDLPATEHNGQVFFSHHTTDTVLHQVDENTVRAWSKYFVVRGDGTAGSGDFQDTVVRTADGWRITQRRGSRGNRPDTDPDGPSTRELDAASWRAVG